MSPFRFPVPPDLVDAIQDRRVIGYDPLVQPALLVHELPTSTESKETIGLARYHAAQILNGTSDHILVIVGPCSIHSPAQALHYARLLKPQIDAGRWPNLLIIMRAYFEKPRTTVGWKGLINDPSIDGTFQINTGLRTARKLLCDLTHMGIPVGSELLDTISPQYISDLISWGAIGARTTESQLHRELASGVSFPIGFKNSTDGTISTAIDAMRSSSHPHAFMGVTTNGLAAIVKTRGNNDVHIILRGGATGPNFSSPHILDAVSKIQKSASREFPSIMVDCSHGNSQKNHNNQPLVLSDLARTLASGDPHARHITGVMIESNIYPGRQDVPKDYTAANDPLVNGTQTVADVTQIPQSTTHTLKYGVSITDACVDWQTTLNMLDELNDAVEKRRQALAATT